MTELAGEVQQLTDGPVPVFWADAPPPFSGCLLFRVGRADETLATCGITHLVEHLALSGFGRRPYSFNGWVEGGYTVFHVSGRQDEVLAHLQELARALSDLPLDRLANERRILASEENTRTPALESRMLAMRFGPTGYGLLNSAELGVDWLGPEELRAWTAERFVAGNAAVWFSARPPDGFSLELPDGPRRDPVRIEEIPNLKLPAHVCDGTGGVALSMLIERSTAANVATAVLTERMHGRLREESNISYSPNGFYLPLDDRLAHAMLNADCRDRDASRAQELLLEILDELIENGPTEEELAFDREMFERSLEDPDRPAGFADAYARDHLMGYALPDPVRLRAEREALTPDAVAAALRGAGRSLIVLAPDEVAKPNRPGLYRYSTDSSDAINGRVYETTSDWALMNDTSSLELGEDAFRYDSGSGDAITWRFRDIVAGVRNLSGNLTVVGRDGSWVKVMPYRYVDGLEVIARLEEELDGRIVPLGERELGLVDVVDRELPQAQVARVSTELDVLHSVLHDDETVRHLAEATRGEQMGLLVLTDRRVVFLFMGSAVQDLYEKPLGEARLSSSGLVRKRLVLEAGGERTEFKDVRPPDRMREMLAAL